MNIELRQLRYFVAVAEEMHFGRAARRLHMTQPPLSQTIQILEAHLGTLLFSRSQRNITLTAAGSALLPEARRLLQQAAALPELAQRAASGASGSLTLSFVSTADYSVLPALLREFREIFPRIQIDLREATTDVQLDELARRQIDAGLLIAPLPEHSDAEFDYLTLLKEPLMLAAPTGAAILDGKHAVTLRTSADLPLIIFPRRIAPALYDTILASFHALGQTPRIGQEAIQMQTIIGLVSAGMGMALVPQSVSNLKRTGVEYRPLAGSVPTVETGIAWRRDNQSPVLAAFLQLLRQSRKKR